MTHMQILFLVLLFAAAAGFAYGIAWLTLRPRATQERLNAMAGAGTLAGRGNDSDWQEKIAELAAPLARLALPKEGWDASSLRVRFLNAGLRHPSLPMLYFAAKAGLALVLPMVLMLALGINAQGVSWGDNNTLVKLLLAAGLGYYLPNMLLNWRLKRHQRELLEALPDAIDLMIVCVEAGLGLDAAIARAGEEMRIRSPALADELHMVGLELRVGASREQALRNFALRTGLDDVSSLVTMLVQTDRFGTSVADALRVHAEGVRTRRKQRAEEAAAKIPLKLMFPLVFCIFPSFMLVMVGPAAISIYRLLIQGAMRH